MSALLRTVTPQVHAVAANSLHRRMTLTTTMCGHNYLFVAQVGDWVWQTVSAACGTPMFRERNEHGHATYLSFFYLRIRSTPVLHDAQFTFGDEIDVVSSAFNCGTESMLTLHRVTRAGERAPEPAPIDPIEFYERPLDGCIYIEAFNRWVARSRPGSNESLVRSSPVGLQTVHLPMPPDAHSPRAAYDRARKAGTFHDGSPEYTRDVADFAVDYVVDAARDLNGVGLVYYAALISIVDSSLLQLWRSLRRSVRSFMDRVVLDRQICYTGNADAETALRVTISSWRHVADPGREIFDVLIHERDSRRLLTICTLRVQSTC